VSRGFVRPSLTPVPSPARAGEGCRRRGEGRQTQSSLPGLLYGAPDGATDAWPNRVDLYCESLGQDTSGQADACTCWWDGSVSNRQVEEIPRRREVIPDAPLARNEAPLQKALMGCRKTIAPLVVRAG